MFIFCGESKSRLEIKEFPVEMPFLGGGGVPLFWSTYIHTHDRLDKLRSALAEVQVKTQRINDKHERKISLLLRVNGP